MNTEPRKPVYTAKWGSVWLPVYRYDYPYRNGTRTQYRFSYSEHGKSKAVTSPSFEKIKLKAKERVALISQGRVSEPSPTQELGMLEKCRSILGGSLENLIPACIHYAQTVMAVTEKVSVGQSVNQYLEEKKLEVSNERYAYLKRTLALFNVHSQLSTITTNVIDDVIKSVKGGKRTKYDAFVAISTWVRWSELKGHLIDSEMMLKRVTNRGHKTEGKREIFSAAELELLLNNATRPTVRTVFALCAFGGLRKSEALRLRWEQIDLTDNVIRLEGEQVKTQTRRAVQILPTLQAWLALVPVEERVGQVWDGEEKAFTYHQITTSKNAKVQWRDNGLRHTAISARCCNGVTLGEVGDWAGNSISEIKKHYLQLISKADAQAWWNVLPK